MSEFNFDGISFHYEVVGKGEPFVFLHGLGGNCEISGDLLPPPEGYSFILLDQRGHGKTNANPMEIYSFNKLADDVVALTKHLGITSFGIGGISMGAGVSVNVAVRFPHLIKSLLLVRIAWKAEPMSAKIQDWNRQLFELLKLPDGREQFLKKPLYEQMKREAPKACEIFLWHLTDPPALAFPEKFLAFPADKPIGDMKDLQKIKVPTLILSCKNDYFHPYEFGKAHSEWIPNSTFIEITPQILGEDLYKADVQKYAGSFLSDLIARRKES